MERKDKASLKNMIEQYDFLGHLLCGECFSNPQIDTCPECRVPLGQYFKIRVFKEGCEAPGSLQHMKLKAKCIFCTYKETFC